MERPNPDELLKQISKAESHSNRGKLKIFFGYAAGVGKTYAMLESAHSALRAGIDVVAGYIEPHTRPETMALLQGLEQLPAQEVLHKGIVLKEFDLDATLARKPQLVLVDELAHTNAEECRHVKRYQDIEELLRAGISVYTTVNVQHLESLNDIVASITEVIVRERIPDGIFDNADQVELVDIEPDDLIERLTAGKIYKQGQSKRALDNFFIRDNLVALREIALRRTADRVNRRAEEAKLPGKNPVGFRTGEHIMICLSSSPSNAKVIRNAARMANAFRGPFTALFVETPNTKELTDENRSRLRENLKLAEQLGAKIATVYGEDVSYQISEYAKASGVSKIVIGRSNNKRSIFHPQSSFVEKLTVMAPNLDIYIIPDNMPTYRPKRPEGKFKFSSLTAVDFAKMFAILTACTLAGLLFYKLGISEANVVMVYLLGILLTSLATNGRFYSASASLISVLVFNFFFTEPRFSFMAYAPEYPVTFLIMLVASLITSSLTMSVKNQATKAAQKAYRTEVLLETSQKLQRAANMEQLIEETAEQLMKLLGKTLMIYPVEHGSLGAPKVYPAPDTDEDLSVYTARDEQAVAAWVYKNKKLAGANTDTLPGSKALYLAVRSNDEVFAVVGVAQNTDKTIDVFDRGLIVTMLNEIALAMEKQQLGEAQKQVSMEAERESLRANLLRAISHDLRTPLTTISGNASMLMSNGCDLDEATSQRLYVDIYDDSMWLINLVENLLSVTRIDNGTMGINVEPELLDEVINEAMHHINRRSNEHNIEVVQEDDLLMAKMDSRLIVQVLINIIDNAIKYTPPGSTIVVKATKKEKMVLVEISDNGKGIDKVDHERLFEMFFTSKSSSADGRRGLGLGLSLCKSIIRAHGGEISARNSYPHGTVIAFTLPLEEIVHK